VTDIIIGAVVAIIAVFAAYLKGRSTERQTTKAKEARARAETLERVKNADIGEPDGGDDAEWLRDRGK
tara:strand:- start:550 stop:753 length:204 start_codon:yes stop_codon:yes gene_type:complete